MPPPPTSDRDIFAAFDPFENMARGADHHPPRHPFSGFAAFGGRPAPPGAWAWAGDYDGRDSGSDHDDRHSRRGHWGGRGRRWGDQPAGENAPRSQAQAPAQAQAEAGDREQASQAARDEGTGTESTHTAGAAGNSAPPDPEEVAPEDGEGPYSSGDHWHRRGDYQRRRYYGRGHHAHHDGPHYGRRHHHYYDRHHSPPPQAYPGIDIAGLLRAVGSHPILQNLRDFIPNLDEAAARAGAGACASGSGSNGESDEAADFTPPVDTFDTETAYVLHVAVPGARKDDVGVSWDADARRLRVAGVVHRPGDEALLRTLQGEGERRVGLFDRRIGVPGTDEVDAAGITARMEDGVLEVTVPKVEKEWTEIHKVDIE